jgi:hypothetical protein
MDLKIDTDTHEDEFPTLCSMYDANDRGNTRAPVEVYEDRFKTMVEDGDCTEATLKDIEKTLKFFKDKDISYVEVS